MFRSLNKSIIPGIQIGTEAYNPYLELISNSFSLLATLILPIILPIYIFVNIKQTENYTNWTYGLIVQKPFNYVLGKLLAIIFIWFCFLSLLCILFLVASITIIKLYPIYFQDYEINHQFTIIWFLKFYICNLGSIALIYIANLFIKSKPIALVVPLFLPFIGLFFSGKGIFFPLSYAYQSTFWFSITYIDHIKLKTAEKMRFGFDDIITGYEILSIIIFALVIGYFYLNQQTLSRFLTKKT